MPSPKRIPNQIRYSAVTLDSYRLYIIIEFIKFYNNNKILLAIYLPYLTYTL